MEDILISFQLLQIVIGIFIIAVIFAYIVGTKHHD
jgi:hypothetical protein